MRWWAQLSRTVGAGIRIQPKGCDFSAGGRAPRCEGRKSHATRHCSEQEWLGTREADVPAPLHVGATIQPRWSLQLNPATLGVGLFASWARHLIDAARLLLFPQTRQRDPSGGRDDTQDGMGGVGRKAQSVHLLPRADPNRH